MANHISLSCFLGRAGDRNERAMQGAAIVAASLGAALALEPAFVGVSRKPLAANWDIELAAARPDLEAFQHSFEREVSANRLPVTSFGRCACAIATLPVIVRHHPETTIVWFDAHGDSNTPQASATGYLGGMILTAAAGLWDSGLGHGLKLSNVVLAGARDLDPAELALIENGTLRLVRPGASSARRLRECVGTAPVYVHLDCDVLNPGIVPTEYAVEAGLSLEELHEAAQVLAANNEIIGLEIAEFEASWAHDGRPANATGLVTALEPMLESISRRSFS